MKILICPRSFGQVDPSVFDTLREAGVEFVHNTTVPVFTKEQMLQQIGEYDGIIVGVDPMDADVLAAGTRLKAVAKYGVGTDNIDLAAAAERGIRVSRTVGANAEAVADFAFGMLMSMARRIPQVDRECRAGTWKVSRARDVGHGTIGIVGLGAIGKLVARRASGFDMTILGYDVYWDEAFAAEYGVQRCSLEEICTQADFITLHSPLMPETRHMIGRKELEMMKETAVLINTARGGLVDEEALLDALEQGTIGGACVDVFEQEPPTDPRWTKLDNVILGSHCAASTEGANRNMSSMAAANIIRDLQNN